MTASPDHLIPLRLPEPKEPRPHDWRWQLSGSLWSAEELARALPLSLAERQGLAALGERGFPVAITPYYFGLIDPNDPDCPIRRQVVPRIDELERVPGDLADPLGEAAHEAAPNLIQRYPDRALLFATDRCAVYCRFCTRSRLVGAGGGARSLERLAPALDYLRAHPEISDVIISGGDPMVMSTDRLVRLVAAVREIES